MNHNHTKAVMRAAVVAGVILGAGATGAVAHASDPAPAAQPAAPGAGATTANNFVPIVPVPNLPVLPPNQAPVVTAPNTAPVSVARISIASGTQAGGQWVTLTGKNLAAVEQAPTVTFTLPSATRNGPPQRIVAQDVVALSPDVVRVVTPAVPVAGKATVTVTNGSATSPTAKAPTYTFTAAAPQTGEIDAEGLTSDAGGTFRIFGTYLGDARTTKVLVGGKAATVVGTQMIQTASTSAAAEMVVRLPAGVAAGYQDVVVTTPGGSADAGVVLVSAATPSFSVSTAPVSVEKGGTLSVEGAHLDAVTSGTLTDAKGRAVTVKVKQPKGEAPFQVVIPARLEAGTWTLVLNTKYASSEGQRVTVVKAGRPVIDKSDVTVGRAGGSVTLTGANFGFLQSVTVGGKPTMAFPNEDGDVLVVGVPPQTRSSVPVVVTTDGGTVTYQLKVAPSTVTGASYDPETRFITVTGTYLAGDLRFTVTRPDGTSFKHPFALDEDGKSATFNFTGAPADGGWKVTVTEASGAKVGSASFDVPAEKGTLSDATYNATAKTITLNGDDLTSLQAVVVTGASGTVVPAEFVYDEVDNQLVATLGTAPSAGSYTVTAKNSAGTQLQGVGFTVSAPAVAKGQLSGASYKDSTATITLSGIDLGSLIDIVVTSPDDELVDATFTAEQAGTKSVAVLSDDLGAGTYTVTAKNSLGSALDEVTFSVLGQG